jgi:hypothetical protein
MRNGIFSTIINPPLIFGVEGSFAFLILFLLFISVILVKAMLGVGGMIVCSFATIYFYFYGVKKSANDPYWFNVVVMAFLFERKRPVEFVLRCFSKKEKKFYR